MPLEELSPACCKSPCWLPESGELEGVDGLGEGTDVVCDGEGGIGDSDVGSDCVEGPPLFRVEFVEMPVDPNDPSWRCVGGNSVTSSSGRCEIFSIIACAIRSPLETV